jgi:hypothetical protein
VGAALIPAPMRATGHAAANPSPGS